MVGTPYNVVSLYFYIASREAFEITIIELWGQILRMDNKQWSCATAPRDFPSPFRNNEIKGPFGLNCF